MQFWKICVKGILPTVLVVGCVGLFLTLRNGRDRDSEPSGPPPKPAVQIALANRTLCATGFPVRFCEHQTASVRGSASYVLALTNGASKAEAIRHVKDCGARVIGPLPPNALLVETSIFSLGKMSQDALFAAATEYLPEDKIDARLKPLLESDAATLDVTLVALAPADVQGLVAHVAEKGGERLTGCLNGKSSVTVKLPRGLVAELAKRGDVRWLEPFERPKLLNDLAVGPTAMNVRTVWDAHGLTGAGQVVTTSDSGIDTGDLETMHADLRNNVIGFRVSGGNCYSYDASGHGTHTAGSIVGDGTMSDGQIRGAAYGAKLWAWFCGGTGGYVHIPDDCGDLFRPEGATNACIHSASWGSDAAGAYGSSCAAIDEYVWEHPDFLPVIANGNDGSATMSVNSPATAKNVLAVGATQNARTGHDSSRPNGDPTKVTSFSSRGPCADGRIKPDVCAPGAGIVSTRSFGGGTLYGVYDNTNYVYCSGTSMATPLTAGAAALVREWLVERRGFTNAAPTAALVKAVLTGGAKDVATPNNNFGWGRVDLGESLYPSNRNVRLEDRVPFLDKTDVIACEVTLTNAAPFDAQLVWIDYPAMPGAASTLVNDLDLIVSNETTGAVWFGNGVAGGDHTNTVESVRIAEATTGEYAVIVRGYDVTYDSSRGGAAALYLRGALEETDDRRLEIVSATPSDPSVRMRAGATNEFSIAYAASTNLTVSCSWTLDGVTLPCTATNFTYGTTWSDHGSHVLVCTVSSEDGKKGDFRIWTVSVWGEIRIDAATGDDATATGEANRPYATIAAALSNATAGDILRVGAGTYAGGLVASACEFQIISDKGPASTIIDGGGTNRCFDAWVNTSVVLSGFTLTNGWTDASADYADGAGAYGGVLTNCVITNCRAEGPYGYGGGAAWATLVDCVVENCCGDYCGGGLYNCTAAFCLIRNNGTYYSNGGGGGASESRLFDCVIADCTAGGQGGGAYWSTLVNCTVRGNTAGSWRTSYGGYWCCSYRYDCDFGGGIDCDCLCTNTVVWGNFRTDGTSDNWEDCLFEYGRKLYEAAPAMFWSCTLPASPFGSNSITNDPLFASSDVVDPTVNELSACLAAGFGGANIGAYRGAGASIRLPEIDVKTATGEEVSNAVASVGYVDKAVEKGIGTNAQTYAAFSAWSTNGLKSTAVVFSTRAYDSFLVREIVAAPTLLAEGQTTEVELTALEPASDGTCSTTLRLMDGENAVPLCSVKAAFARHTRVGENVGSLAAADPANVEAESADEGRAVKLTIQPPAATSRYFMHFNLQP